MECAFYKRKGCKEKDFPENDRFRILRLWRTFGPDRGHYGIDIASDGNQIINATLDGTVVFSTWSINDGYCIGIQHEDSYSHATDPSLLLRRNTFSAARK